MSIGRLGTFIKEQSLNQIVAIVRVLKVFRGAMTGAGLLAKGKFAE